MSRFLVVLGLLSQIESFAGSPPLTATAMIEKAEGQLRGKTSQSLIQMTIHRPSFSRTLSLRAWSKGGDRALVEILKPAKEKGVTSLRVESEMWNYLPNSDQVVRVPTSLMLQSWMGSDFTNDDLMKASSLKRDYHHKILGVAKIRGQKSILIDCVPKSGAPVVWGRVKYWADSKSYLPIKQEFYDDAKRLVRTFHFSHFKKMDDRVIPTITKIVNAQSPGEFTTVTYQKVIYDRNLPSSLFDRDRIQHNAQQAQSLQAGWFFTRPKRGGF